MIEIDPNIQEIFIPLGIKLFIIIQWYCLWKYFSCYNLLILLKIVCDLFLCFLKFAFPFGKCVFQRFQMNFGEWNFLVKYFEQPSPFSSQLPLVTKEPELAVKFIWRLDTLKVVQFRVEKVLIVWTWTNFLS